MQRCRGLQRGKTANHPINSRAIHPILTHLFISEHQQNGLAQFVLVEHTVQLIPCGVDAVSVVRVHHEDQSLRVLVVVPPQRTDLVLPSDVPNCSQQAKPSRAEPSQAKQSRARGKTHTREHNKKKIEDSGESSRLQKTCCQLRMLLYDIYKNMFPGKLLAQVGILWIPGPLPLYIIPPHYNKFTVTQEGLPLRSV